MKNEDIATDGDNCCCRHIILFPALKECLLPTCWLERLAFHLGPKMNGEKKKKAKKNSKSIFFWCSEAKLKHKLKNIFSSIPSISTF